MDHRDLYRLHDALTASLVIVERLMIEGSPPERLPGTPLVVNPIKGASKPAGPDDDEIIPPKEMNEGRAGVFLQDMVDLTRQDKWKYRARRNVLMDAGEGRFTLVWSKGAVIPDEEAERQGVKDYTVKCEFCDGVGTVVASDGKTALCGHCNGARTLTYPAPWVTPDNAND